MTRDERNLMVSMAKAQLALLELASDLLIHSADNHGRSPLLSLNRYQSTVNKLGRAIGALEYDLPRVADAKD